MKLLRYGAIGQERPAVLDQHGVIRDLSGEVADIEAATLAPAVLARLRRLSTDSLPAVGGAPRIGVPVKDIGKFIAVGLNYRDHAIEANMPIPAEPVLFTKAISCLSGPFDDVMLPKDALKADWEVELGVFIGRTARCVDEQSALDFVAGYTVVNDLSERAWQLERGSQWDKGKGFDTFGPVGPWLVTADEVQDPQALGMFLDVNGRRMQTGNTRTMIFDIRRLIAYVSTCMTLYPGDLLITGTPPGVGMGMKPQAVFLQPGDTMRLGIEKLGEQRQCVVPWRRRGEEITT
jgi:2,4-didehydro-3-deoxy-L-rhamnonate hydrolase